MSSPTASGPASPARPTAVFGIIGDEILAGRVHDANGYYMARRLREAGVDVLEMAVLGDRLDRLVEFIRHWSPRVSCLFLSGGIGPTHDDVTRPAVAQALHRTLTPHPEAVQALKDYFGEHVNEPRLEMARLPEGARLIPNPVGGVPGCIVENVYVLPGVPRMLHAMFDALVADLGGAPLRTAEVATTAWEADFSESLARLCADAPSVRVGSYPQEPGAPARTLLTFESADAAALEEMLRRVRALLAPWDGLAG